MAQQVKDPSIVHAVAQVTAVAQVLFLAWEFPRATGTAKNKNKIRLRSSCRVSVETNLTRNHEVAGSIPSLIQWVKDPALT